MGGLAASLFFVSLAFACAGSRIGHVAPWALSALALLGAAWAGAAQPATVSRLAVVVYGFAAWIGLHTLLLSPAYTPAGLYHPLLLALAFAAFRRFDDFTERRVAIAALGGGAALAAWGLAQVGPLGFARAQALFETPATFVAVINLLLVPLLALVLARRGGPMALVLGVVLAAAAFAGASRGGLLALGAGIGTALLLAHRAGLLRWRRAAVVLGLLAAGWVLAAGLRWLPAAEGPREAPPSTELQDESSRSRLELYAVSWRAWQDRPVAGTGYLTFRYALERDRARVPSYGNSSETWFAHNDFLQALQELGPLGLAFLLALAWLPGGMAYRRLAAIPEAQRAVALAAASATTAMACHAMVDFPFYVPACLVLYGALLGALDRRWQGARAMAAGGAARSAWPRAARTGAVVCAAVLLLRPVLAEAAAEWGMRRYAGEHTQSAAFWLETARRLEPADWRYHWYAGQFWDGVAGAAGSADAARYAGEAFAAGIRANPLEVSNLLGLIALHRRHARLLASPADRATLAAWVAQAEALAPFNSVVRRERALLEAAR
jgi:O-antigen ligase